MDERRSEDEIPEPGDAVDPAALGTAPPPEGAPPGARVDDAETHVPGPSYDGPGRAAKPWSSSLAAESDQAGVANAPDPSSDQLEERPADDEGG